MTIAAMLSHSCYIKGHCVQTYINLSYKQYQINVQYVVLYRHRTLWCVRFYFSSTIERKSIKHLSKIQLEFLPHLYIPLVTMSVSRYSIF